MVLRTAKLTRRLSFNFSTNYWRLPLRSTCSEECVFLDIGSGVGKAVLAAASSHFTSARGVEILNELHVAAESAREKLLTSANPQLHKVVTFVCGDALDEDLSSTQFLFCNCAVFTAEMLSRLEKICASLPFGALALVTSPSVASRATAASGCSEVEN